MRMLRLMPVGVAAICLAGLFYWFSLAALDVQGMRVPIPRPEIGPAAGEILNLGTLISGAGTPADLPGAWTQFRGAARDNKAVGDTPLARQWGSDGPPELWRIEAGEGHAGAAILNGRVYLVDYDRENAEDAIRCLSLADGREIWRYTYSVEVKRNHGMSRTVPAVTEDYLVAIGPKCHVHCLNAKTGELIWKKDLVEECGTVVPPWYAGQCPLIEADRVILAPGADPLMMAIDLKSGETIWRTEGGADLGGMTHSSIAPMEIGGVRQYVYCAQLGVAADTGQILWTNMDWKISIANIPSPVPIGDGRIFLSGGYNAGCMMIQVKGDAQSGFQTETVFQLKAAVFGSDQQTPIVHDGHIYGVAPNGEMTCLDLEGSVKWTSGGDRRFGLGPYLFAQGMLYILDDMECTLHLAEASPDAYSELAMARPLKGHDAWAPMALAEGRLILRDLTQVICLDVSKR